MGLSLPLNKFSFHYPHDGEVDLTIHPDLEDDPLRWELWQFRPTPQHLVAVCAERVGSQPSNLTLRTIVPAVEEEALAIVSTRNSR
jgi:4'-phosphopantetheinyl transferase